MFIYLPLEGIPARGRNNIRVLLSIVSAAHGLVCHREIMSILNNLNMIIQEKDFYGHTVYLLWVKYVGVELLHCVI